MEDIDLSSDKLRQEKKIKKIIKITLLILVLLFLILYFVVGIFYNNGNFSVSLDKNLYFDKGLIIYDSDTYKVYRSELYAQAPETFDNISAKWLPNDLHDDEGGTHNGDNYLAYTFFIENTGDSVSDYWYEVNIDDVIRNVDDAVRVRIYKDGKETTYAKKSINGTAEPGTVSFLTDTLIAREHVSNFNVGDKHKFTVVLWIEGSDPECTDNILGGEFKVHLDFKSQIIDEKEKGSKE